MLHRFFFLGPFYIYLLAVNKVQLQIKLMSQRTNHVNYLEINHLVFSQSKVSQLQSGYTGSSGCSEEGAECGCCVTESLFIFRTMHNFVPYPTDIFCFIN